MNNQSINWQDPLYLLDKLTEEEKSVLKTAREFCRDKLLPRVIDYNKNRYFDKNL